MYRALYLTGGGGFDVVFVLAISWKAKKREEKEENEGSEEDEDATQKTQKNRDTKLETGEL